MHKSAYFLIACIIFYSCKRQPKKEMETFKHTNVLIHETSPYLLQHAHNPVDWHAWNEATLAKAKRENKLILISVGYAACHWCHVMEHESFENDSVAKIMNEHFINIKIDREERPDIDQIYMTAVQLMTNSGGWPLNCVALPDGRPFWGGTYFPKDQWMEVLSKIAKLYKEDPDKIVSYAEKLTEGIRETEVISLNKSTPKFTKATMDSAVQNWSENFDHEFGGLNRAPKFPMPNNYHFLMRYAAQTKDKELSDYTENTLQKMALGGLFDQVGGGFARYSTDKKWHIPHFEKMLYDNAQLVSLYADAYLIYKNDLYKETVYRTLDFVESELTHSEGAFYSSLDADSYNPKGELEEGAFYVWTEAELQSILKSDYKLFARYYNVNDFGKWEGENYHFIRTKDAKLFAKENKLSFEAFAKKEKQWQQKLYKARSKKERPRLDDKTLTSWNALMLKAYVDAYRVFDEPRFLESALKNARFIKEKQRRPDGGLNHSYKNGKSTINGYLEDYAAVIDAYLALYENTLDQSWLDTAKALADYCFTHFQNKENGMFYFTSDGDANLIARKMELTDNVIPASNSILARNLYKLGLYFENKHYKNTAKQMLNNVIGDLTSYPSGYSNWLQLYADLSVDFYEVAILGTEVKTKIKELNQYYIPNKIIAGADKESEQPLLKNRFSKNETLFYICVEGTCKLPVSQTSQAVSQINSFLE